MRGHGVPRDRAEAPAAEAAGGELTPRQKVGNRRVSKAAGRGRARHREAEGVAGSRRAVTEPPPPAHANDEERGRPAQPHVRRVAAGRGHRGTEPQLHIIRSKFSVFHARRQRACRGGLCRRRFRRRRPGRREPRPGRRPGRRPQRGPGDRRPRDIGIRVSSLRRHPACLVTAAVRPKIGP